jgi:hypothetical protein
MLLLGDLNWKIPGWLGRILPRFNIEGTSGDSGRGGSPLPGGIDDGPLPEPAR